MANKFTFDISTFANKSAEDLQKTGGGGGLPAPGRAYFLITAVENRTDDKEKPRFSITCDIEAHEDDTQIGKTSYNSFQLYGKGAERAVRLALACGILNEKQWNEAQAVGQQLTIDFDQLYGKHFCGELKAGSYKDASGEKKQTCKVEWDFVKPSSPDAEKYPRVIDGRIVYPAPEGEPAAPPSEQLQEEDIPF